MKQLCHSYIVSGKLLINRQHRHIFRNCLRDDGAVERVAPVHGRTSQVRHDGTGLFTRLPSPMTATRYHSLAVVEPVGDLIANAWSEDGVVMGMRHVGGFAHGVQFHPESIASEGGLRLLGGFLGIVAGTT